MEIQINHSVRSEEISPQTTVATEEWQLLQQLNAHAPKVRGGFTTMPGRLAVF
jgi:hypothetical protein